ncbi:hypothetical protein Noda2021_04660 [Candidatus Dependentiae bacterium Noda2021]|nr:hypothetical protein Noda2021_04660 [Candidatus Dependentiae bacterium Noda2021]
MLRTLVFTTMAIVACTLAMEKKTKPLNIFLCKNTLHEDIRLKVKSNTGDQKILCVNAGTQQYIFQPSDVEIQIVADSDNKVLAQFDVQASMKIFYVTMHDAERLVHVSNSFNEETPLLNTNAYVFNERDHNGEQTEHETNKSQCVNCRCQ